MNRHVKDPKPKPQMLKREGDAVLGTSTETRAIEAFLGPDGQIYLPEGTVLAEGEELVLEGGLDEGKPVFIKVI